MKAIRQGKYQQVQAKEVQEHIKKSCREESVEHLGVPRKYIKKSESQETNQEPMEYSKIPLIPEIKLSVDQMKKDPIELLVELQKKFEQFGAVKLVTAPEWKPPYCFNYGQIGIKTRVQHLHKLRFGKVCIFQDGAPSILKLGHNLAYNVRNFQNMAQDFQKQYRFKTSPRGSNRLQKLQSEYWNLVNGKYGEPEWKYKTTVQYAADLPVSKHGSGFPLSDNHKSKDQNFDYHTSLFNLNNIYKSPLSILNVAETKKQFISGVTTPWVYMGMMFSSFCWHVEDLWLNSINYNHKGGTKTWYIIPRKYKEKFDEFVVKKTGREDLLDRITFMIDPLEIMKSGIPVYKVHQNPGEYVCTFFKSYHAGFSHAFNIGQAVNFASPVSLDYIKEAINFINENKEKKPAVLSLDWLVYENKIHNKKYGDPAMQNLINQQYTKILKMEQNWVKKISQKHKIKSTQQIQSSCKYDRNSCSKCRNYLYLSSFRCVDCSKNYCPQDFRQCCKGNYELVYREPNADRKWINLYLNRSRHEK